MWHSEGTVICRTSDFNYKEIPGKSADVEVFFAETADIDSIRSAYCYLRPDEQQRAARFRFETDKMTFSSCHTFLRLILSQRLNIDPLQIEFSGQEGEKPRIVGYPVHFNISHTKDAFAVLISGPYEAGIDIEKVKPGLSFEPVINRFFSKEERSFILKDPLKSRDRFFLLWTRKESLLKAAGTGLISNLGDLEVHKEINILKKGTFDKDVSKKIALEYIITSFMIKNYYLSVALPEKCKITLKVLDNRSIIQYLK